MNWKHIPREPGKQSLHNLHVLMNGNVELGFVEKPKDTRGCANAWRAYKGTGSSAEFLGHNWTKVDAQRRVEQSI